MEKLHPVQLEIYRRMTPEQKLRESIRLYKSAWHLKAAWLRQQNPNWTEEQVQQAVKENFMNART